MVKIRLHSQILKESNIIKIPQSELDKADRIYNFIQRNYDQIKRKIEGLPSNRPLILPTLKDYFTLTDYKQNTIKVSVGLYDEDDMATGKMYTGEGVDVLTINITPAKVMDLLDFKDFIEHELVHAIDPKTRSAEIYNKSFAKQGAEPKANVSDEEHNRLIYKYLKQPWEFDAFTAPLVNKIKRNIQKQPNPEQFKDLLNQFFSDLRTKEPDELASEPKYKDIPWLFTTVESDSNNINKVSSDYTTETDKMKVWLSKPTLYKRFLQRLFRNI